MIAGVASLMVHLNRSSLAGASLIQPVMDRMVGHVQVSLHWGGQVSAALMGSLLHGLPLQLQIQDPVAVYASEGAGGAAVAEASPTLGAVRKGLLRDQDALQQGVDAILVIEEFGGAGSLTEALRLLGISPIGTVFVSSGVTSSSATLICHRAPSH